MARLTEEQSEQVRELWEQFNRLEDLRADLRFERMRLDREIEELVAEMREIERQIEGIQGEIDWGYSPNQ